MQPHLKVSPPFSFGIYHQLLSKIEVTLWALWNVNIRQITYNYHRQDASYLSFDSGKDDSSVRIKSL